MEKSISLFILDFNLFNEEERWYNQFRFRNVESGRELSDLMEIVFLEMKKLNKNFKQGDALSKREQWAMFLTTNDEGSLDEHNHSKKAPFVWAVQHFL